MEIRTSMHCTMSASQWVLPRFWHLFSVCRVRTVPKPRWGSFSSPPVRKLV
jgi:hypothetical protein